MSKGEVTRKAILDRAAELATRVGVGGLSIGQLADDLGMSKSGLFAHFRSKEALQVQLLEHAAAEFVDAVIRPALKKPRGEPRLRALFELWRTWPARGNRRSGCLFVATAAELDDQPGPARDLLVKQQKDWLDTIAGLTRTAIAEGHFTKDVDPDQFAFEMHGIALMYHHATRLLEDPKAEARASSAFEALLARSR